MANPEEMPATEAGQTLLKSQFPKVDDGHGVLPGFLWRQYDELLAAIRAIEAEATTTIQIMGGETRRDDPGMEWVRMSKEDAARLRG